MICPQCRHERPLVDSRCARCGEQRRMRYHRLRAMELCVECGRKREKSAVRCKACREKAREQYRRRMREAQG